ncbi:MAG: DUF6282 family protein [Fusobacteriaceae bacterium]|jgi:hypothetical protein|nr:DUF6282 family protein [Fusobacteriaceae bacterium]
MPKNESTFDIEINMKAKELIKGSYDLHIHTIPSHVKRSLDDFQLMKEADEAQMAGVLIKNHYESTGSRAILANRTGNFKVKAFGGIVLNWPVGGLNPYAAESSLNLGGSIVWMPTRDSYNCLLSGDMPGDFFERPGIKILDDSDKLLPVVYDIFDVVLKYNACIATGHLSPKESVILCKEARKRNLKTILTHPEWERTVVSKEIQKDMAAIGVRIEKCWYNIAENNCTEEYMIDTIKSIGAEHIYISTDRGQIDREHPVDAMVKFIEVLLKNGFNDDEIKNLTCNVAKSLVN